MAKVGAPSPRAGQSIVGALSRWGRAALGDKPVERLTLAFLILGCLLRGLHFLGGRSLWLDESMVADSIVHRDWAALLQPLTYSQVAPLGWLIVERAAYEFLGGSDFALRAPALLAGIGALLLFARIAQRSFESYSIVLAVACFAISDELVHYSAEVKAYGFDVLVSVVGMTLATTRLLPQSKPMRARDHLVMLLVGLVSLLVSFPAAFVLAGLGGALFLREALNRRWGQAGSIAVVSVAWLVTFLGLLSRIRQSASTTVGEITSNWRGAYAPLPTSLSDLKWYPKAFVDAIQYYFGPESMAVWLVAIVIGAVLTFRKRFYLGVALLGPLAAALIASSLRLYPFSERLILFALPELLFLGMVGVQAAISGLKAPIAGSVVAAVLLLYGPATRLWGEFTYYPAPYGTENIQPVMREVATHADVDAIYVNRDGLPAFRYYRARTGLADIPLIEGQSLRNSFGCLLADLEVVSRHRRIWVVHAHPGRVMEDVPADVLFTYFADAAGRRAQSIDLISVHAYLYEFDAAGAQRVSAIRNALAAAGVCHAPQRKSSG